MPTITIELTPAQAKALRDRFDKRTTVAAAKAAIDRAAITPAMYKRALRQSMKEDQAGKGKTFDNVKDCMEWLKK